MNILKNQIKKIMIILAVSLGVILLNGCSISKMPKNHPDTSSSSSNESLNTNSSKPTEPDSTNNPEDLSPDEKALLQATELLKEMTLQQKIGQLFIIRPESLVTDFTPQQVHDASRYGVTQFDMKMQDIIKKYPVGGIALFGKNILSPKQLTSFINGIQNASSIPLLVGIDEEGGSVSRIANSPNFQVTKYKSMESIGATKNPENAYTVGLTIGTYLKNYGFNLDFAPVADINTNPDNIVIGNRSFGSDPGNVSKMVNSEIDGLHQASILTCIKHFPGHGDTKGDTHAGYVSTDKDWNELKSCELIPFINAFPTTDMVMVSHITCPNITADKLPASLSYDMIEGKLRTELGYNGVVITDSLAMGAITQDYSSAESAVKAIMAGVDLLLMPENFIEAYDGVYKAVTDGRIQASRIDDSVLQI